MADSSQLNVCCRIFHEINLSRKSVDDKSKQGLMYIVSETNKKPGHKYFTELLH